MLGTGTFWSPLPAANLSQLDTKTQVGTDEWRNDLSDVVLDVTFPTVEAGLWGYGKSENSFEDNGISWYFWRACP